MLNWAAFMRSERLPHCKKCERGTTMAKKEKRDLGAKNREGHLVLLIFCLPV